MGKLKDKLIEEIRNSKDKELLEEIYHILREKDNDEKIQLTDTQIKSIKKAKDEVKEGEFFTEEQIDNDLYKEIKYGLNIDK